jgi:hypothetical protein
MQNYFLFVIGLFLMTTIVVHGEELNHELDLYAVLRHSLDDYQSHSSVSEFEKLPENSKSIVFGQIINLFFSPQRYPNEFSYNSIYCVRHKISIFLFGIFCYTTFLFFHFHYFYEAVFYDFDYLS